DGVEDRRQLGHDRLCLSLCALHQDDEVVGETDEPIGRQALAPQVLTAPCITRHVVPATLELSVERTERDVRQQGRNNSSLWRAGEAPVETSSLRHHPSPEKRPDQSKDPPIRDSPLNFRHHSAMVDAVETSFDVAFNYPPVVGGWIREVDNLSNGVLAPPPGTVAIGRSIEVDFKYRLQHQLEGHLHHAVAKGGDA